MVFNDYPYQRIDMEQLQPLFEQSLIKIQQAKSADEVIALYEEINQLRNHVISMTNLCSIRHTIDTTDAFYETEQAYYDETSPIFTGLENQLATVLIQSPFRNELEMRLGTHLFNRIEVSLKTFKPEIIEDLQIENRLSTEYGKRMASAKIAFDNKINNLSQMAFYMQSPDRLTRKAANDAVCDFFAQNGAQIDAIYDGLVKVRTNIAIKLGFKNFIELGYARLGRTDYDATMVANYRKQVYEDLLPVVRKIIERQQARLGIDNPKNYDLNLNFLSGNPTPKGDRDWMLQHASTMYHQMSTETGIYFDFMLEHQLLDLDAKAGKEGGGYCTYLPDFASPFIFANFNGTSHDVDVLTHEAGHAFQVYTSQSFTIPDYRWPTLEACEIHSMSMEFFAWPWMELFFEQDTAKYHYAHLANSITFIPYGVCVDEFQHLIYEHPEMTKEERKQTWRNCEKKYLPYKIYDNQVLENGTWWYRQGHIFGSPFYYIDYTLAQVCAHQFWIKNQKDHNSAWADYLRLCQAGGSQSFLELLKIARLQNPFSDGTIKHVISELAHWLDCFDQTKLK